MRFLNNLFFVAICLAVVEVHAAGFSLYETSPRAVAMGGATMGSYFDASAVYSNPSLITDCDEASFMAGVSLINPGMELELRDELGVDTYSPHDQWFPPIFAYYVKKLSDEFWFGIGEYTPYGLGVKHPSNWPGRFNSVETKFTSFMLSPTVAWKVNDSFSVAAGAEAMYMNVLIARNIPGVDQYLEMEADSIGFGGNLSLQWKLAEGWGLGLIYRSEVQEDVEGDAIVKSYNHKTTVSETLTLPQSVSLGVNCDVIERWHFGAIATWTDWTSYDSLTLSFDPPLLGKIPESGSEKNWNDVWRIGTGIQYDISEFASFMLGYVFDEDPIDLDHGDYLLPAGDRHIFSIGLISKLSEKWDFQISFAKIFLKDRHINRRPEDYVYDTKFNDGDARVVSVAFSREF